MRNPLVASVALVLLCTGCHTQVAATTQQNRDYAANLARQTREGVPPQTEDETGDTWISLAVEDLAAAAWAPLAGITHRIDLAEGSDTPAVAARLMDDGTTPDQRRQGIAALATKYEFTHRPPYTTRYQQIAQTDPDYTVRAMAIRALNISRDKTATPLFIAALGDANELVRLEAAKALANVPDPGAIPVLMPIAEGHRPPAAVTPGMPSEEAKDVRIAAADALRNYRNLDAARTLVNLLNEREFGIAWQSHRSLVLLTRRDLRYNQAAWLEYLSSNANPFG